MPSLSAARELVAAGMVFQRRGFIDIRRPAEAIRASHGMRRYGPFGGWPDIAARHGDAPAVTDDVEL